MRYTVSAQDATAIELNQPDVVKSVLQNIAILLSTRQQSVPLYREFGLPMSFIDRPVPAAKPIIIAEVKEAIEQFEPRATILDISFVSDKSAPGTLIPIVEVEIGDE